METNEILKNIRKEYSISDESFKSFESEIKKAIKSEKIDNIPYPVAVNYFHRIMSRNDDKNKITLKSCY